MRCFKFASGKQWRMSTRVESLRSSGEILDKTRKSESRVWALGISPNLENRELMVDGHFLGVDGAHMVPERMRNPCPTISVVSKPQEKRAILHAPFNR